MKRKSIREFTKEELFKAWNRDSRGSLDAFQAVIDYIDANLELYSEPMSKDALPAKIKALVMIDEIEHTIDRLGARLSMQQIADVCGIDRYDVKYWLPKLIEAGKVSETKTGYRSTTPEVVK